MNLAYLLTGGNMGVRSENLRQAADLIHQRCGIVLKRSAIYETAAWGMKEQPAFLNQALLVQTTLAPEALLNCLLEIELLMGRKRQAKYGPRIIDIDILLYNHLQFYSQTLTIPHPQLPNRRFALVCLEDLAPQLRHPVTGGTISQLLATCPDALGVQKYSFPNRVV